MSPPLKRGATIRRPRRTRSREVAGLRAAIGQRPHQRRDGDNGREDGEGDYEWARFFHGSGTHAATPTGSISSHFAR